MQIYIGRDGKQYGPLSLDKLNAHLESGRVRQGDLAWFEGAAGWGPISAVPGVRLPKSEAPSKPPQAASPNSNVDTAALHSSVQSSGVSLWNPNAAVNWSILFGAPLGSYLHARNWGSMGELGKEKRSLIWFWMTAILTAAAFILPVDGKVYGGVWLWSLILWYFISARAQAKHVRQEFGSSYRRRGFVKPLLIALACYLCAVAVGIGIYMVLDRGSAGLANIPDERPPAPGVSPTNVSAPRPSVSGGEQKPVNAEPVTVERLTLGPSVDSDQRVAVATTTFSPEQTIYASVVTRGVAPEVTLSVKWFYRETGELVYASSQVIAPRDPAATAFQITKPDGWPVGGYQIQIYIDNVLAAKQDFVVAPQRLGEADTGKAIVGTCLLEVLGRRYIDGRCPILMSSDGSFQIGASESEPLTYFATVVIVGKDVGDGRWNEESGVPHAHTSLGTLHRNGACWESDMAKICAARLTDRDAPSTSFETQAVAPRMSGGAGAADVDGSTAECSITFEPGRWSSAENEHGLTMTATDGEKLYIGKSCDVFSSRFGTGRWEWANGGVLFQFERCSFGWAHAEPPIEDNDCQSR